MLKISVFEKAKIRSLVAQQIKAILNANALFETASQFDYNASDIRE